MKNAPAERTTPRTSLATIGLREAGIICGRVERGMAMRVRSRGVRVLIGAIVGLVAAMALPSAVGAASPCAPGQPPGRPPGQPPGQPGQPPGRPPEYPPGQCQLRLSQSAATAGSTVTAAGSGFSPGSAVSLSLGGDTLGGATADGSGAFTASVTIPAGTAAGSYDMTAVGPDGVEGTRVLSASFTVLGQAADGSAASGAALPSTGSSSVPILLLVALGLVILGTMAVVAGRRRREEH